MTSGSQACNDSQCDLNDPHATVDVSEPTDKTHRRLKVLICAYACRPDSGSEEGMGWNWVRELAKHADLWVLTEENRYAEALRSGVRKFPELKGHVHVEGIYRRRYGEAVWSHLYYMSYRSWQKEAYLRAQRLHQRIGFDLAHQLNMIGYREPGYLWKLPVPFVWGPVGGHAQLPWRFFKTLDWRSKRHYAVRNVLNSIQMRFSRRVDKAAKAASVLLAATREDQDALYRFHNGCNPILLNEQGAHPSPEVSPREPARGDPIRIVWCGFFTARKCLPIGLAAIRKAIDAGANVELNIIGSGETEETWKREAELLGVSRSCRWHGVIPRKEVLKAMRGAHVLLFTSLQEGTPAVVLEALQNGLPVICHDACGFGSTIDDSCGIKVPLVSPATSIDGMAAAIYELSSNPQTLRDLSIGALSRAQQLSWSNRAATLVELYWSAVVPTSMEASRDWFGEQGPNR